MPVLVCTLSFAAVLGIILVTTNIGHGHTPAAAGTRSAQPGSGVAPDAASTVRDWYVKGGEGHLTTVARDVTSIQDDRSAGDMTSMQNDCGTLLTDVQAAQVYPSISEPQTESHWSKALGQLGQAAADCNDGTTDHDSGLVSKSASELKAGSTELALATSLVNSLSGN
ncbi:MULTISPECIES: hypothetical protein [unclassified Streptomyces]|uniref:hypothetical protein n=1 Tax=unclassified Streptomyces TaxID=2593676 RepID=UPI000B87EB7E|nr:MULTISPECIES: hypothetical protein [unclassified Streptomyces]MYS22932.1 hypothetical protein [Streptomyces sp. SID4948]